ncbi:hypothetical protein Smp_172550 [Schistosoma mansoni]|uniref:hypothetical protein n=1 Tax=Schistosoma mansoni TaxID=6183 RepID=UPI00019B363F|nr:hypothetical protein Smp_172550 [Schistosoma mansoni]|eukprot:XP_018651637.1 hypothetical protein Smp_172550 [Schistosoma mansoni]
MLTAVYNGYLLTEKKNLWTNDTTSFESCLRLSKSSSTISNNLSSANVSYSSQLMNSPIGQYNNKNIHQDFDHKYKLELPQNSVPSSEFNNSAFSNPKSNISELNIGENKSGKLSK